MTKTEYLSQLRHYLKRLSKEDYEESMDYFTELFDEVGPDGEQALIAELGTPKEAAHEILSSLLENRLSQGQQVNKKRIFWLGVLTVLAAPMAIPLLIAALCIIFAFVVTVFSLLLAFILVGLALILLAGSLLWDTISLVSSSLTLSVTALGTSLLSLGLGLCSLLIAYYLSHWSRIGFLCLVKFIVKRGTPHENMA